MKRLIFLPGMLAIVVSLSTLSTAAFAQEMKPLLAMDNQLAQAQAWLEKAIDKNSTYKSSPSVTESISQVRFDGCRMSFRAVSEHGIEPSPANGAGAVQYYNTVTTLAFDLKGMDLGGITMTPSVARSNMLLLTLPSIQGQQNVAYESQSWNARFNRKGALFAVTIPVKAELAEQVKAQLLKTSVLCQLQK